MLNLKLKTIASLIAKDDIVIDTCCDHAYLAIYLKENNLCQEVYASDISKSALEGAKKNIKNAKIDIKTYLSDGFNNINESTINTGVIAGVGTNTALKIVVSAPHNVTKFIISSNNDHYLLRKEMQSFSFYLEKEIVIKENNKFYPIMLFIKSQQKINKKILKYGKSNNYEYLIYLLKKEQAILTKIPKRHIIKCLSHINNINYLKKILKERKRDYFH